MAGNKKRSSFSFFSFFKGRSSSSQRGEYETRAYKVYPSDEDRGRWVAEPRIDEKASAYITHTTDKWGKLDAD
ncbi:hypothetical protein C2S52_008175 [Perilla frutescens var. hirtella]|nr:hypothetical protein C2S51_018090 [Perilla frutescens var. frutescens]KAH6783216.1 hypothetical protein C2S52_008175 [Perilla frutescens var. hirtella]